MRLQTQTLDLAYEALGPADGNVMILLHGFPYAPDAFAVMAAALAADGYRVMIPHIRGFGGTRLRPAAPRSGQQAAIAQDVLDLMDGLGIARATLAGFDWGGRAACIVASLAPARVKALITAGGYLIQNLAAADIPLAPAAEHRIWYQHFFCTPRGAAALAADRAGLARYLWRLWSPSWQFSEDAFARSAAAFDNPDFIEIVLHSYRHRLGQAPGFEAYAPMEAKLAAQPPISVPSLAIFGAEDGILAMPEDKRYFAGPYERLSLAGVGHNPFQEAPEPCLKAISAFLAARP